MAKSWASSDAARATMKANRSRDTKPEMAVRRILHARGLRYRVDTRPESGTRRSADIVFRRARIAVFIDGCYWHGCPTHFILPSTNQEFWQSKIAGNMKRDEGTVALLQERGWTILRYWEHESPSSVAADIEAKLWVAQSQES